MINQLIFNYVFELMNWSLHQVHTTVQWNLHVQFKGLVQDCSNSSALAMELLQSCNMPSNISHKYAHIFLGYVVAILAIYSGFHVICLQYL